MLLDGGRTALNRARRELKCWASPVLNPFCGQMLRAEARGKSLWRLPLILAIVWAFPMLIDWSASLDGERDLANDGALFWIGLVLMFAFFGRLLRCGSILRIEVIKRRFEPLQLLPISSARRAWLWCAPATLFALMVCALALPALLWGLGSGLFSPSDALGLTLLALMASWGRPLWRPTMWRGQLTRDGAAASNRSDGFVAPPAPANDDALWICCGLIVAVALIATGVGGAPLVAYWDGLPIYLRATGAEFWMTWPLFAARWLMQAQPFFGFGLPPILLILPLWLASVHNGIVRLGAVTANEPYWTPARLHNWRIARKVQFVATAILVFGLSWPGSLATAYLGAWFSPAIPTRQGALAAWWLAFVALGALAASALWIQTLDSVSARVTLQTQLRRAGRASARGLGLVALLFIGVHLLGAAWTFGALWRQLALPSLAVAFVFWGAYATTWAGMKITPLELAFKRLNKIWLYGGLLACLFLLSQKSDAPDWLPTLYFASPWTLWLALRDVNIGANPTFWLAIATHCALIFVASLIVWRAREIQLEPATATDIGQAAKTAIGNTWKPAQTTDEPPPKTPDCDDPDFDDFEDYDEMESLASPAPNNAAAIVTRAPLDQPRRHLITLLRFLERFDNPLLLLETRRVIGNLISNTIDFAWFFNGLAAFILIIALPIIGLAQGTFPVTYLIIALCLILLTLWAAPLFGIDGAARAYDNDRLDGSLQALFLTPRTETEIAVGKIGPFVVRGALMLLLFAPMWLLGFVFCVYLREPALIVCYAAIPFFASTFALRMATLSHWIALSKRKIGPGGVPAWVIIGALLVVPHELSVLYIATLQSALVAFGIVLVLCLLLALESLVLWRLSVRELRRWRLRGAPGAN